MHRPVWRFTTRRTLAAVAISAVLLFAYRSCPPLGFWLDDGPYNAMATVKKDWDLGPSPSISVDVFEGTIQVDPSDDDRVHAEVFTLGQTKVDQATSEAAIREIDLSYDHRGDALRIVARGASGYSWGNWVRKEAHLTLRVPANVRLDLRTGRGDIRVGRDYAAAGVPVHRPVSAVSIRARNDSRRRLGHAEGNIIVETTPPAVGPGEGPASTRLQLDAPGRIEIRAVAAVVEATAWHGDSADTAPFDELDGEGTIRFEGSLAVGEHSFHSAHRLYLILPSDSAFRVDALARGGAILGDLLPKPVEPRDGQAAWKGSIGPGPGGMLRLRADEGPIELGRSSPSP